MLYVSLDLQQLGSAGPLVEPSAKTAEGVETRGTNRGSLLQMADNVAPETSTAAASNTSPLSVSITTGVVEPPDSTKSTQVTPVIAEPPNMITEPATAMPTPLIAPPSVVPAAPASNSGLTHV